ncbi:MAG: OmpH family outer membrane protein [candidate division Zixibacteria bacterium]
MRKLVRLSIVCFIFALMFGGNAIAQKLAFVDSERIFMSYTEWVRAQEQFAADMKEWDDEAAQMQTELQDMYTEYEKQKLILSADKKAEREAAIVAKEQLLQAFTRDVSAPGGRAERRQNELAQPLLEKITASIEKVAIEENIDFVFNSGGLSYGKKELDITDKVLEILEEGE